MKEKKHHYQGLIVQLHHDKKKDQEQILARELYYSIILWEWQLIQAY